MMDLPKNCCCFLLRESVIVSYFLNETKEFDELALKAPQQVLQCTMYITQHDDVCRYLYVREKNNSRIEWLLVCLVEEPKDVGTLTGDVTIVVFTDLLLEYRACFSHHAPDLLLPSVSEFLWCSKMLRRVSQFVKHSKMDTIPGQQPCRIKVSVYCKLESIMPNKIILYSLLRQV